MIVRRSFDRQLGLALSCVGCVAWFAAGMAALTSLAGLGGGRLAVRLAIAGALLIAIAVVLVLGMDARRRRARRRTERSGMEAVATTRRGQP